MKMDFYFKSYLVKRLLLKKNLYKIRGITLIELMVSIAIAATVSVIALPNMNRFIIQLRVNNEISGLQRLLLTARNYAINSSNKAIICPLTTNGVCTTNWHKELSVFIDNNNNKVFDSTNNEKIIITKAAIKTGDTLIYGKRRTNITYQPTGHLSGLSNGTFRYCPLGEISLSRAIVIARSGRFYVSTDNDGDSRDETRGNKEITCD